MLQVVKALLYCHTQGILHRDIRPENIMINHKNEVKLIDFGFSTLEKKRKPELDIAGSPAYIAPETLDSQQGMPADVWSLGVTFF
jgi:serine/threonine-protein kinase GIN4